MCDPVSMITGGTALLSAAMGAAQKAIGVTQQLQHAAQQRNDFNFLADQQRNAASVDEMRAQQAEQAGEADADTARQKAAQRLGQLLARLAAQGTAWVLTAEDDMAYNEPGKAPAVRFVEQRVTGVPAALDVAPASATIFRIPVG